MEFSTTNLSELETIVNSLIAAGKCACHIINPHKTRILMWKKVKDDQVTYYLRIGIQKFASQEQIDRNGEIYWRYWTYEEEKDSETNLQTDPSPITKYQQRIVKTEALNYGKSTSSSPAAESTSQ